MKTHVWHSEGKKARYVERATGQVVGEIVMVASHVYGKRTEPIEWWQAYAHGFLGEYMGFEAAVAAVEKAVRKQTHP